MTLSVPTGRLSVNTRALAAALLIGCSPSLGPVAPSTRLDGRVASQLELVLAEPCSLLPGGAPMGRPDGVQFHTLPAGRYVPKFEDERGVFFDSPTGVIVVEPAPRGTSTQRGGIYLPHHSELGASEYLGDVTGVTERVRMPEHCPRTLESVSRPKAD